LPNIKKLSETGMANSLKSVFPPDSIPSWITCFTGKDPSHHGVLESINYLSRSDNRIKVDTSIFQGRTFWDILGESGNEVCVINPFMAYPPWAVNGVMISGPVFIDGDIQVSDPSSLEGLILPKSLGGIVDFPTRKTLNAFIKKTFSDTEEQCNLGISVINRCNPDFLFQTFLTMDRIQHFLWRFCDRDDPTYPGKNRFEDVIKDFYIFIDGIIGRFREVAGSDGKLIVISDHGHGRRCTHCFNINEYLRHRGYLKSTAEGRLISPQLIIEKLKNRVLRFMNDCNLEDYISVVARFIPKAKNLKKGEHITHASRNLAYASDFTGTNPFGGICINKDLVKDYEQFRTELIKELAKLEHAGSSVFRWVRRREEMFNGPFLNRYPDILFSLDAKYGINWSLHTKVFTINPTHKKISGGHNENGVFFTNIPSKNFVEGQEIKMTDFFPTLLDIFGIDWSNYSKGESFLKNRI